MANEPNVAIKVAKDRKADGDETIIVMADGTQIQVVPVSAGLIDDVSSSIKAPEPPMWHNDQLNRDEPNYADPTYIQKLEDLNKERGVASMDAMIMFGLKILNGLPEDETWLKSLKYLEKRGRINLSEYDLDDPMDVEFLYKRYIGMTTDVMNKIMRVSQIAPQEVAQAEESFRSD